MVFSNLPLETSALQALCNVSMMLGRHTVRTPSSEEGCLCAQEEMENPNAAWVIKRRKGKGSGFCGDSFSVCVLVYADGSPPGSEVLPKPKRHLGQQCLYLLFSHTIPKSEETAL